MVATILCAAMFSASVLSGMLGVGVAFAAVPILGIAGMDLVNSIQPIALFLNGVTALFSAIAFAWAGFVDWQRSFRLALVASIFSPIGALATEWVRESALWGVYFLAVLVVVYLLLNNRGKTKRPLPFGVVLLIAAPVSAISGLLGVGPGFLLVPVMIFVGFSPRSAAAMNAVAVTPASFLSLLPHLGHASIDAEIALPIVLASAAGALLGGYLSSTYVSEVALRRLFVVVILALSLYKGISLEGAHLRQAVNYGGCPEEVTWTAAQFGPCQVPN
jgi:uncharacterized membrane protein YfcA